MAYQKVFIVILNWNGLQDTLECLESVFKLDYPNFEVIVVENGSTDNSVEVIRKTYPQVILIKSKVNLGYTGGNNIGMRYALKNKADYVWLLNNDTVVEADTLSKLLKKAEQCPEAGLISPVVYYYDAPGKIQFCGSYADLNNQKIVYPVDKNLYVREDFTNGENVCLWGTALLIKRNVIDKIGYLDEEIFAYYEDTEYSLRAIKAGFRNLVEIYAKVHHNNQSPDAKMEEKGLHYYHLTARNEYLMWTKYLKGISKILYIRKYFANVIGKAATYRFYLGDEFADAWLNGAWSGICRRYGPIDKSIRMPLALKKIILWHPYFWANLLQGNFSHIIFEILRRVKLRFISK